jgi:hypothetical protein
MTRLIIDFWPKAKNFLILGFKKQKTPKFTSFFKKQVEKREIRILGWS